MSGRFRSAGRSTRRNATYSNRPFRAPRRTGRLPSYRTRVNRAMATGRLGRSQYGELKGMDTTLTIAQGSVIDTTSTNASMFTVNLVAPGNGPENRVGRKITMKSLRLRGSAIHQYGETATTGNYIGNYLRMVVVYDSQPSGAVPTFATIFGRTVSDGTESSDILDSLRYDNTMRFRVLKDTIISSNPVFQNTSGGTTDAVLMQYPFDEFIKLGGLQTQFGGQSTPCTIADISSGALYVFFRATLNTASTNLWSVTDESTARLRYSDPC